MTTIKVPGGYKNVTSSGKKMSKKPLSKAVALRQLAAEHIKKKKKKIKSIKAKKGGSYA